MQYVPFSVIKSIHAQTHSATPNAPVRPYVPKRHPIRDAVRRWQQRRTPAPATPSVPAAPATPVATPAPRTLEVNPIGSAAERGGELTLLGSAAERTVELTLVPAVAEGGSELCEADVRDRGTTPAGVARAC
ncbi:hypothetical protein [Kribbella kalugense]|uniref:Uncharacterized protein n=1 Tax=Kribbella kalugense TaxID=2512221 RepID=A0A4R7ZJ12_9ACTN|nr:hypothetical protein [Kribbella kalugense]TDW17733.1 hypothetical protein EV650_4309 [Kribbella kalugense]